MIKVLVPALLALYAIAITIFIQINPYVLVHDCDKPPGQCCHTKITYRQQCEYTDAKGDP